MAIETTRRPHASPDLHGNAPDKCEIALLLVDVINDLEFEGGDRLLKAARPAAHALAELKRRAQAAGVPCIYANDNFGRWRSDFNAQVQHVLQGTRGQLLAELLAPGERDYFVLKARHSAFYETSLALLLEHLGVKTLLMGGFTTDNCVNFTASDAFLRGLGIYVLRDGCAAQTAGMHNAALTQMKRVLHAEAPRCEDVVFRKKKSGATMHISSPRADSRQEK